MDKRQELPSPHASENREGNSKEGRGRESAFKNDYLTPFSLPADVFAIQVIFFLNVSLSGHCLA